MKLFMTLVNSLFEKQLNKVTKNPISDDPRSTSLFSILKKPVRFIHYFRTDCSRVYSRLRAHRRRFVEVCSTPINRLHHLTGE